MKHGGWRPGAGRKKIDGRELKLKVSENICDKLEKNFVGSSLQDKIRNCLEFGIKEKEKENNNNDNKYTVIDLFSGAGGLSRGFMDAGFDVVLGIDFDAAALKTFQMNHGHADILNLDLFNLDNIDEIQSYIFNKNINLDVLVGGPPCQGFSLAGKREEFDKRNGLYFAMVKVAERLQPKVVVLENVPGMMTLYNGAGAKRVREDFGEIGYILDEPKILYAPEYGIPQIRKRVFFVLRHKDMINNKFQYPTPTHSEEQFITTEEAINDLPSLIDDNDYSLDTIRDYISKPKSDYQIKMRQNSERVYNHTPTNHSQKTIDLISLVPEGKNYKSLPEEILAVRKFKYNEALTRYHSKRPSRTIDTGHRTHFHYKWNRIPTVRENARLQSFPDDFIFYGNKQEQYRQVGNAVPPMLGKVLAEKVKELLDNE